MQIDLVERLKQMGEEFASIAILLHQAELSRLGGKALDIGVKIAKFAEEVDRNRVER